VCSSFSPFPELRLPGGILSGTARRFRCAARAKGQAVRITDGRRLNVAIFYLSDTEHTARPFRPVFYYFLTQAVPPVKNRTKYKTK
jgi:hypothetical protein